MRLDLKLFVDKQLSEKKWALEEGATRLNHSRRNTQTPRFQLSAPRRLEGVSADKMLPVCVSVRVFAHVKQECVSVCVRVGVLKYSTHSCCRCSCLFAQVNVCHI